MIRRSSKHQSTGALFVLAAGAFVVTMDGFVLSGLVPEVATGLRVSLAAAGQLTTVFALSYAIASPIVAGATGALDRRRVLAGGMAVFVAGMVIQALGAQFAVVVLGRVVAGAGAAGFQATAYASAGSLAASERRGRALALVLAGGTASLVLGVPFGMLVGQAVGWRGALWAIAVLGLIAGVLMLFLPTMTVPAATLGARIRVLGDRRVLAVLGTTVLVLAPGYLGVSFIAVLAGAGHAGVVLAGLLVLGLGQILANRVVGWAVDRHGPLPVLFGGTVLALCAFVALALVRGWTAPMLGAFFVLGLAIGFVITPQQVRYFALDPVTASIAIGLNGSAIQLGAMTGAGVGGAVLASAGANWLAPAGASIALAALLLVRPLAPERRLFLQ